MLKATVVLLAVVLSTCSTPPSTLEEVLETGQLRVVTRNSPTTYYRGPVGYEGPEFELVEEFRGHLQRKYNRDIQVDYLIADQLPQIFSAIESKQVHMAAAGLTITAERADRVRFGPAYQDVSQYLVYRLNSGKPRRIKQLLGKRIEVLAGSSFVNTLEEQRSDYPELVWSENPHASVGDLLQAVQRRKLDYTIVDSNDYYVHRYYMPDLRKAMRLKSGDKLAWAFNRAGSDALVAEVDEFLASVSGNGVLERIHERYYGHTDRFDYVGTRAFKRDFTRRLPQYRELFTQAAAATGLDWRLLAAIGYQESHWDPSAVSPTGVRGLMMLTRATAGGMGVADRHDPVESIAAGSRYFMKIYNRLDDIPHPDRTWFALAAYNVGYGHLQDARRLARKQGLNADRWVVIQEMLPLLTEREHYSQLKYGYARGWEPVRYVQNVRTYYEILSWLTLEEALDADKQQQHDLRFAKPTLQTASMTAPLSSG